MEESISKILELAISQGIWAALYIYLFFRMLKENKEREDRYQATIDRLSDNIETGIEKIQGKLECIGNLVSDGMWSYEWQAGRQLKRMSREGQALSFKYGHDGLRIEKVLEHSWYPEITKYTYHGKLLTHMNVNYFDWDEVEHNDEMHFFYDAQSRPAKVSFNGEMYTYVHNLQGDIVGILDNEGTLVVEYKYDAWGHLLSTAGTLVDTLGKRNPFRYRGYIYDEETALYYLCSRYYNSNIERFINADSVLGRNLFSYANNNPIMLYDPDGKAAIGVYVSSNPSFTEAIKAAWDKVVPTVIKGVSVIVSIVSAALTLTKPRTRSNEEEVDGIFSNSTLLLQNGIDQAVRKAISKSESYTEGEHSHHIVPKKMPLAEAARTVLENAGIDVMYGLENRVTLSAQFHKYLHNDLYVSGVNLVMIGIEAYSESKYPDDPAMLYTNVTIGLRLIASCLTAADQYVRTFY